MDIHNTIGCSVLHKTFGKGIIQKISEDTMTVAFVDECKKFPVSLVVTGPFFTIDDDINATLSAYLKERQEQKSVLAAQHDALTSPQNIISRKPTSHSMYRKAPGDPTIWIKFEGQQNPEHHANLHAVNQNGKTWYVLNYTNSKKPVNVKEGDEFFMSEGITDFDGSAHQVITGRGHLYAFNESNISPESWYKAHPWMPDRKWYVLIKDFEELDTPIRNCLRLDKVILHCGTETYESSSGKERDYDYIHRMHTQKIHMKLTRAARDYINSEFDKLKEKFGSNMYYSEM